jgi:hypothetical protein
MAQESRLSLAATPSAVSFTDVPQGETYSQSIRLSNVTSEDVQVTGISVSGAGISASGLTTPENLAPGANVTFKIVYKPSSSGKISGAITLLTSADSSPLQIEVVASALPAHAELSASVTSLDFENVTLGTTASRDVTFSNLGNKPLTISAISVGGSGFHVAGGSGVTLAPGQEVVVNVTFDPLGAGAKTGTLSVSGDSLSAPLQIALSASGLAASDHSVFLQWDSAPDTLGYFIYRGTQPGGPYVPLNSSAVDTSSYTDSSLASGQTYYYVITFLNSDNQESGYSAEISAVAP